MTKSSMMEGLKRKDWTVTLRILFKRKEMMIFVSFIIFGSIINGIVLNHLGPSLFIDSFKNPSDYTVVEIRNGSESYCLVVQKSSHPDFSIDQSDELFCVTSFGTYDTIIAEPGPLNDDHVVGKIVERYSNVGIQAASFSIWCFMKDTFNPYRFIDST